MLEIKDKETLSKVVEKINAAEKCLVLAHQNPDGDTLGSMIAIGAILLNMGKKVDHCVQDPVPAIYKFLPNANLVKLPNDPSLMKDYDLVFSLDCGSIKRLGEAGELWQYAKESINIDHHVSNERFATYNLIEAEGTSTGQVLHGVARALDAKITPEIASLLYTTLLTDTGCYSNSNTNALAMTWAAELIDLGAEHGSVYRKVFLEKPFKTIKVFGIALANMELLEGGKAIWTYLTNEDMAKHSAASEDTDDIVDHMMRTQGVEIGMFFREDAHETKVSLRSNTGFDVSKIAVELGGGGHKRAAGINLKKSLSETKELVMSRMLEEFKASA